jgi:replicative DNA helicase
MGGYRYLAELASKAGTTAPEYYARIIRANAVCREARRLFFDGFEQARPHDIYELLTEMTDQLHELAGRGSPLAATPLPEVLDEVAARYRAVAAGEASGIATGLVDLDTWTGGMQAANVWGIACRPSVGKTSLGLQIGRHVAVVEKKPVLFITLEQPRLEVGQRLLAAQADIDLLELRTAGLDDLSYAKMKAADKELRQAPIAISDTPGQTLLQIVATARRHHRDCGPGGLGCVVVDYLQLAEPNQRFETRTLAVGSLSRGIKNLSRELAIPLIVLSQLNRAADGIEPQLAHLRDSGEIEQDFDTVLFLWPEDNGDPVRVINCKIAKQRNGPTRTFQLAFRRSSARFESFTPFGVPT